MIHFDCTACGERLTVADELAGKHMICRHCDEPQSVPGSSSSDASKIIKYLSAAAALKRRGCSLVFLDAVRIIVWVVLFFNTMSILNGYTADWKHAQTAPQQGAIAADGCF